MRRVLAACLMASATAAVGAPVAAADPADLVPYCSGDQTPMDSYCRPSPSQVFTHDSPGADPQVGIGPDPAEEPAARPSAISAQG